MTRIAGLAMALAIFFVAQAGHAQSIQFQLGLSDGMILYAMSQRGYTDINITKKKLTKAQAEGCREGKRYKVEISFDGRIRKEVQIGNCRNTINQNLAQRILRNRGYNQIFLRPEGNGFIAVACRSNRRFQVVLDPFGDIRNEKLLGRCGGAMSEHDIAALLRARGFSRIDVKRGPRGAYAVEACHGDNRVKLVVGPAGGIVREQRTGRCDPPIHPASIPSRLARYGFSRIEVVDRRLPRYLAHACRGNERLEIAMNRFGEITDERRIGRCDPPLNRQMLEERLRGAGYTDVNIVEHRADGFVADVCEDAELLRLELTIFGETVTQKRLGDCPTRPVGDVLRDFERRGFAGATLFLEACRKGRRVRIELDRTGDEAGRQVLGRCR